VQVPYEPLSVISTLELLPNGLKQETFGWGYPVYLVFLVGYFFAGIAILIAKYFSSKDPQFKNQLVYILFGTGLSIFIGITTNLILPHFGSIGYEWAGPLGTVVMILSIAYAITKHKLWNFKILAIQLFVALMILTLLLQVFVSQNPTEQIARGIIFFIVTVFSYFLVKNLLREVEDRERMEKLADELSHANERLKIIDVEKSDFVSITSHQFRTPLTVIKGYTSMLQEGSFGVVRNDKIKDALDKIYRASERLVVTIEEFLNISRIEQNQMTYIPEKVDLRKLTGTTIEEASVSLKEADIALTFHAQITEEYFVKVDPAKIKLVIHNIIDNAIKYTPKGGKILVTLHKQPSTKTILLGVKDTGIGMTPDIQNRLFEKFSRGPGTSKLHTEGRGLGLFVARQIMKAQGGKIWAESEGKDKGSIFYLEFPDWEYVRQRQEVKEFVGAL
jgi:signal transduction histidine kinase